ncbi:MAG: cyclase family protein [Gemmatimonadales bacterium]|jgi:arylformamidase
MIDITQPLSTRAAAWPGDTPFQIDWTLHITRGDNVTLSRVTFSPHVGTHADAPAHYEPGGSLTDAFQLGAFLGPVRVVDARWARSVDLGLLESMGALGAQRLLVRSVPESRPERFENDFAPLAPEAADALVRSGLRLYGTDAPSVDPVRSTSMSAHRVLGAAGVPIIENLDLALAEPGDYDLIALPLRMIEAEAAPVRAVLLPTGSLRLGRSETVEPGGS